MLGQKVMEEMLDEPKLAEKGNQSLPSLSFICEVRGVFLKLVPILCHEGGVLDQSQNVYCRGNGGMQEPMLGERMERSVREGINAFK